jgi:hypothetical protein
MARRKRKRMILDELLAKAIYVILSLGLIWFMLTYSQAALRSLAGN